MLPGRCFKKSLRVLIRFFVIRHLRFISYAQEKMKMVPQQTVCIRLRNGSDMLNIKPHETVIIAFLNENILAVITPGENVVWDSIFYCHWTGHFSPLEYAVE